MLYDPPGYTRLEDMKVGDSGHIKGYHVLRIASDGRLMIHKSAVVAPRSHGYDTKITRLTDGYQVHLNDSNMRLQVEPFATESDYIPILTANNTPAPRFGDITCPQSEDEWFRRYLAKTDTNGLSLRAAFEELLYERAVCDPGYFQDHMYLFREVHDGS